MKIRENLMKPDKASGKILKSCRCCQPCKESGPNLAHRYGANADIYLDTGEIDH